MKLTYTRAVKELILAVLAFLGVITDPIISPSPSPQLPQQAKEIEFAGKTYTAYWYSVQNAERLMLKANFDKRESAATLMQENNCEFLINGGFYSTKNKPIGLWTSTEAQIYSDPEKNALFNGYVWRNLPNIYIDDEPPREFSGWAMQTGPVLILETQQRNLKIRNDEMRRRTVAAITADKQLIFLALTLKNSDFEGPYLKDLPQIVKIANKDVVSAINLDGGSASAFLSPEVQLNEANPIGSFFCYNPDNDPT